jgi:hypothetical protein
MTIKKHIRKKLFQLLFGNEIEIGDDTVKIDGSSVTLPGLTSNPTLATGKIWFRSDTGTILYTPDGTNTKNIAPADWNTLANKPSTFPPSTHGQTHEPGGTDEVKHIPSHKVVKPQTWATEISDTTEYTVSALNWTLMTTKTVSGNKIRRISLQLKSVSGSACLKVTFYDGSTEYTIKDYFETLSTTYVTFTTDPFYSASGTIKFYGYSSTGDPIYLTNITITYATSYVEYTRVSSTNMIAVITPANQCYITIRSSTATFSLLSIIGSSIYTSAMTNEVVDIVNFSDIVVIPTMVVT